MESSTCTFRISSPQITKLAAIEFIQSPENKYNRLCIELINKADSPESPTLSSRKTLINEEGNSIHQITAPNQSNPFLHSQNRDERTENQNPLLKPELKLQSKFIRFYNKKKTEKSSIKFKRFTPAEKRYIGQILQYMIIDMKDQYPTIDRVEYLGTKINVSHISKSVLHRQLDRNLSRWKKENENTCRNDIDLAKKMHNANKQPNWNYFLKLIDRRRDKKTITLYDIQSIKDNLEGIP